MENFHHRSQSGSFERKDKEIPHERVKESDYHNNRRSPQRYHHSPKHNRSNRSRSRSLQYRSRRISESADSRILYEKRRSRRSRSARRYRKKDSRDNSAENLGKFLFYKTHILISLLQSLSNSNQLQKQISKLWSNSPKLKSLSNHQTHPIANHQLNK